MKEWERFETTVAEFIAALDPTAVVKYNIRLPDKHTGHPRQRDVWVEAKVCQIFPVKILISCKRWAKKLNEQDIDAFLGELHSSGEHKGVLYSFSGFTEPALEKALALGICCCKLYKHQPPDLPESLLFRMYCCTQQFRLALSEVPSAGWGFKTFGDLLLFRPSHENNKTVLDYLSDVYH